MKPLRTTHAGFSLIELLVVMAVIALLAGILAPTLRAVRERGRTVACQSNLRQLGLGSLAYSFDFDGALPRAGAYPLYGSIPALPDPAKKYTWVYTLEDYSRPLVAARCPSDQSPYFAEASPVSGLRRDVSYGLNVWTSVYKEYRKLEDLPRPEKTVHAAELVEQGTHYATADRFSELCWEPRSICGPGYSGQIVQDRHDTTPNWLFHDGSVAAHVREQLHAGEPGPGKEITWIVNVFQPDLVR